MLPPVSFMQKVVLDPSARIFLVIRTTFARKIHQAQKIRDLIQIDKADKKMTLKISRSPTTATLSQAPPNGRKLIEGVLFIIVVVFLEFRLHILCELVISLFIHVS